MADTKDGSDPNRRANGTAKKGFTPNPRGRPSGARGMLTLFNEKGNEKVSLKLDGKVVEMRRLDAFVTNVWNRAIAFDPKAAAILIAIFRASGQLDPTSDDEKLDLDSEASLKAYVARVMKDKGGGANGLDA